MAKYGCPTCGTLDFRGPNGELVVGVVDETTGERILKRVDVEQVLATGILGSAWRCTADDPHIVPGESPLLRVLQLLGLTPEGWQPMPPNPS